MMAVFAPCSVCYTRFTHHICFVGTMKGSLLNILLCCSITTLCVGLSQPQPGWSSSIGTDGKGVTYRRCVVVGGGPVGLAAALTLSSPPHYFNVSVLEKTTDEEFVGMYDPGKAYLYNVNPRGLKWVTKFPDVLNKVVTRGYSPEAGGFGKILRVPANPDEPIAPMANVAIAGNVTFDPSSRSVWIPRHLMVDLMMESCEEQEKERLADKDSELGSVTIYLGKSFASMVPRDDGSLVINVDDGSSYEADLVVGADGISSPVREYLADESKRTWLQSHARSFRVKRYLSPSAGLRLKSLQLPGDFSIPNTTDSVVRTEPTALVVMRSKNKGRRRVSLGMLPVKDRHFVRPANVITRPDHEIWTKTDGKSAKEWMQGSFPRLPFDSWVNDTEWERFASAKFISYPKPQYSPGSAVSSPTDEAGVVLVGDACHAFPPDIGQGINAGLQDVLALDRALQGRDIETGQAKYAAPPSLGQALRNYQANRGPEHRALIRLSRFGAPYQYNQSWLRDRIGQKLWFGNFLFRMLLNKITFGIIPPPAAVLMNDSRAFTYRRIMQRCDSFNYVARAVGLVWIARLALLRFGRVA